MRISITFCMVFLLLTSLAGLALAQEPGCVNGGPQPWRETAPIGAPTYQMGVIAHDGIIYLIGGGSRTYTMTTASVYYAAPLPDGTITEWRQAPPLNYPRRSASAVVVSQTLYITSTDVLTAEKATINPDGSLGTWQETPETVNYSQPPGASYYRIGGSGLVERSVDKTTWQPVNIFPRPSYLPGIVESGGYLYVIGGNIDGLLLADVYYWRIGQGWTPDYGVSINDGALFTNQVNVTLTVGQPPLWNKLVQVSNDGGFAGSIWRPYNPCQPWTITRYGSYIIPRTVYVRFKDAASGQLSATFSDDIILDETPPEGTVEVEEGTQGASLAAQSEPPVTAQANYTVFLPLVVKTGPAANVTLRLAAVDDVSGVAEMRVANVPGGGAWQPYRSSLAWYLPAGGHVYVQFKDWAGNISEVISE